MAPTVLLVTHFLATGILVADVLLVLAALLIILYALELSPEFFNSILSFFEKWGIWVAFLATLGALLGSLYYSVGAGFKPCELCIIQRVFMYPLVLVLGAALIKKSWSKAASSIAVLFSLAGAGVAMFHYYGQMFNIDALPCQAAATSCAKIEFIEYGYITIPMMSLTLFLTVIITLSLRALARRRAARLPAVS